jgi:hypothetical protein
MLLGTLLATVVTLGAVFAQEYMDPSFRTPAEVSAELNIPVLASVPQHFEDVRGNGTDAEYFPSIPLTTTVGERSGN